MRRGVPLLLVGALALGACGFGDEATRTSASAPSTGLRTTDAGTDAATAPSSDEGVEPDDPSADAARALATTTTTHPRSTSTTAPSTTVGLTTVETLAPTTLPLPVPAPPPPPRADEPYVELGTIEIPRIGVTKTLLEGITLNTLDLGPGHWPGTAMPGELGNAVIAGHRTSHDKPFRHIDALEVGDEVIFTTSGGRFVYAVTGTTVVAPDAMYIIEQTPESTATLFACHPPGSTRQRIVVSLALQR